MTFDRIFCLEEREDQRDRLDFVRGQINRLTDNVKERIRTLTDDVAAKVTEVHTHQLTHISSQFITVYLPQVHVCTFRVITQSVHQGA